MQCTTKVGLSLFLHFQQNKLIDVCVPINKQIENFKNVFNVLSLLCQGKKHTTNSHFRYYSAGNITPSSHGLRGQL
jgi:hypothetical protein